MATIKSTFAHDAEGWMIQGDVSSEGWVKSGGDPKGHLEWVDAATGATSFWVAPSIYNGNLSGFYGGKLSYSMFDNGDSGDTDPTVVLTGANGVTLVGTTGHPGADWTDESIKLTPKGGWEVANSDGTYTAASGSDIRGVLNNVAQLLIRAEYVNGPESGGLDNVKLSSRASSSPEMSPDHDGASFTHLGHAHFDHWL